MSFNLKCSLVSGAALCVVLAGCGGSQTDSGFLEPVISDQAASTLDLSSDSVDPATPTYHRDRYNLEAVMYRLRRVAAPLFEHYGLIFGEDWEESRAFATMVHEVSFVVKRGVVTVTNKATGGVIFQGPLDDLASGVFTPANIPDAGTPPPPSACTYTPGAWGACQSNGMQTRAVTAAPAGCTGTPPASTQSCTYVPPVLTCTSFSYNAWTPAVCPSSGQQSRTVATSSPAGCSGGNPVLTQACTYVPPPVTCTSFSYSAWTTCSASGTQTRTVTSSAPAGCTGGSPVLSQACTPPPPAIDGAALYTQNCSSCHGNGKKGSSASKIQSAINSNTGGMGSPSLKALTPAQIQAISTAP